MGRMTAAERREIEAEADRALAAGEPGGRVLVYVPGQLAAEASPGAPAAADAPLPERWDAATVESALWEAGKALQVVMVAGYKPKGFSGAAVWPEFRRLASKGDYPGDPRIRRPIPSAAAILEAERRMDWLAAHIQSIARRRCVAMRMVPHADAERPYYGWRQVADAIARTAPTATDWHKKGCDDIAKALNIDGEPVAVALDARPSVRR